MTDIITREQVLEVLKYEPSKGFLYWRNCKGRKNPNVPAGSWMRNGYRNIKISGGQYLVHRIIWLIETGEWPENQLDHIDMNKSNNRFSNLRQATTSQNNANREKYKNNASGYKGVIWHKHTRKWRAAIGVNGKSTYLGIYDSPEEAARIYDRAALEHYGKFAYTNF